MDPEEKKDTTVTAAEGEKPAIEAPPADAPAPPRRRRGFAAMDPARVRELASRGGAAAHRYGTAHRFTPEEARTAGRKGGVAPHRSRGRKVPAAEGAGAGP